MCGIAGWLDFYVDMTEKNKIIENMSETLKRRGPDENDVYLKKNICLIHRRLIVVDPENGKQPMTTSINGGNYVLVYNGEIYNTDDVRKELISKGFKFSGHSDTEVVLKSYCEWGPECLDKLNGIFAFAIWDEKNQKLFLARDRIGVKPLFFYQYENGLIFGSEIKTLLANPIVKPEVTQEGLKEIFFIGPGRTSGYGIIKNVFELKPGEYAIFDKNGLSKFKYWKLRAKEFSHDVNEAMETIRFLLKDSITRQLISDVPLCCFLSGGLDSSIISKFASDYYRDIKKETLTTYSVDYLDNQKYFKSNSFQPNSDSSYIKIMSDHIHSNHKNVVINNSDLADALIDSVYARDLPAMADIDSSLLLFCREVKKDFKVALSGECADEIFGGYPWYHNKEILFEECFPWSRTTEVRESILKDGVLQNGEEYLHDKYKKAISDVDKLPSDSKLNSRMREMFSLNFYWFMQTLLIRKDRMSMYNGLEVRVPFCDYRIVEYAYNIPWEIKALNGREKGLLRESMKGILPDEIVFRKKSPYPKTFNPLYMKIVSERVKDILNDKSSSVREMLDKNKVIGVIEHPDNIVSPWYGQLMRAPQILAYIIQVDTWFKCYNINIV